MDDTACGWIFCMWHNLPKVVMHINCLVTQCSLWFLRGSLVADPHCVFAWHCICENSIIICWGSLCHFSLPQQRTYQEPKRRIWACTKSWTRPCRNWTAYKHTERKLERTRSSRHIPLDVRLHSTVRAVKSPPAPHPLLPHVPGGLT